MFDYCVSPPHTSARSPSPDLLVARTEGCVALDVGVTPSIRGVVPVGPRGVLTHHPVARRGVMSNISSCASGGGQRWSVLSHHVNNSATKHPQTRVFSDFLVKDTWAVPNFGCCARPQLRWFSPTCPCGGGPRPEESRWRHQSMRAPDIRRRDSHAGAEAKCHLGAPPRNGRR